MVKNFKAFNESNRDEDLLIYCQEILANLIDDDFSIRLGASSKSILIVRLDPYIGKKIIKFGWSFVKDYINRLIQVSDFELNDTIRFGIGTLPIIHINKEDVVNDINIPETLTSITLYFK